MEAGNAGSNEEVPTSWEELYNINLIPTEVFLKFRKEIQGYRVGVNLEVFLCEFNHYCGVLNSITCLCIWGVGRLTFFFSFIVNILCKYDVILLFLGNLRVNRRNNCFQNILVFLYNIIFLFLRALRFRSKFLGFFWTVTDLALSFSCCLSGAITCLKSHIKRWKESLLRVCLRKIS